MYNGALLEAIKSQTKLDKSLRYKSYDKKPVFHTLAKKDGARFSSLLQKKTSRIFCIKSALSAEGYG
jgi:hypothetical protein